MVSALALHISDGRELIPSSALHFTSFLLCLANVGLFHPLHLAGRELGYLGRGS